MTRDDTSTPAPKIAPMVSVKADAVAKVLAERAAYFDSTKGYWDRKDTARSYRETAKDIARILNSPEVINGRH